MYSRCGGDILFVYIFFIFEFLFLSFYFILFYFILFYFSLNLLRYPNLISGMILANTRMEADRPQDKKKRQETIENLRSKQDLKTMADKMVWGNVRRETEETKDGRRREEGWGGRRRRREEEIRDITDFSFIHFTGGFRFQKQKESGI